MSYFTYVNFYETTLSAALSSTATSMNVSTASGLPSSLASGEIIPIVLTSASNNAVHEIVYMTAISGTTLTITRGEEGTSALSWSIGDYVACSTTAGSVGSSTIPNATSNNQPVALGQFPFSAGGNQTNGYVKFPNGIILQWGFLDTNGSSSGQTITYPITFPNAMIISSASDQGSAMNTGSLVNLSTSQGTLYGGSSAGTYTATTLGWIAIGY